KQSERVIGRVLYKYALQAIERVSKHISGMRFDDRGLRPERCEREAATHCDVENRNTPISAIHGPKYEQVLWKPQVFTGIWELIRERNKPRLLVGLEKHYGLSEHLGEIRAIDLVYYKQVVVPRVLLRLD